MSALYAIPGLIWPAAGLEQAITAQPLPGLSALLSAAQISRQAPQSLESWLAAQFGAEPQTPWAALRQVSESPANTDGETIWVCADPVSLRLTREFMLLDGADVLDLQAGELQALEQSLNENFADVGRFSFCAERGYLALDARHADKLAASLSPLADVLGRPVAHFQPQGEQAAWWSRLANELQVFCHNHPVNTAREARGASPLNGIWLWGAGRLPAKLKAPARSVAGPAHLLAGLAHCAGTALQNSNSLHAADWIVLDELIKPARERDLDAWLKALQRLDAQIFLSLSHKLKQGQLDAVQIIAPGDTQLTQFDISPRPFWKFWQKPASLAQIARLLSEDPATR